MADCHICGKSHHPAVVCPLLKGTLDECNELLRRAGSNLIAESYHPHIQAMLELFRAILVRIEKLESAGLHQ